MNDLTRKFVAGVLQDCPLMKMRVDDGDEMRLLAKELGIKNGLLPNGLAIKWQLNHDGSYTAWTEGSGRDMRMPL